MNFRQLFACSEGIPFAKQPTIIEFARRHNLDLNPRGSTLADLLVAMITMLNELERGSKKGNN